MPKKQQFEPLELEIADKGVGNRDESWWCVRRDNKGQWLYVHKWNNLPYDGPPEKGEKAIPLDEAKNESHYRSAVAAAKRHGYKP